MKTQTNLYWQIKGGAKTIGLISSIDADIPFGLKLSLLGHLVERKGDRFSQPNTATIGKYYCW